MRRPSTFSEKNFTGADKNKMSSTACLNRIFRKVEQEGLSEEAAQELSEDIRFISEKFSIKPKSAVILAAILERTGSSNGIDEEELARYIGCTNIEFMSFHDCIRELEDLDIICMSRGRNKSYVVSVDAEKAIEFDTEYSPLKKTGLSSDELFSLFRQNVTALRRDFIDNFRFLDELNKLIDNNQHLDFCRKIIASGIREKCSTTEQRIFLYLCHRYVNYNDPQDEIDTLMNFTVFMEDDARLKRSILLEKTALQVEKLVSFGIADGFVNNDILALSDEAKETFFTEVEIAPVQEKKHKDMVCCQTIKAKDLFYNPRETEQINRLDNLLQDENFRGVQDRLEEMGMRKGFNAIFYGGPGTGKTACVYELARRTGRDIFCIDMSKLKSKWVGDSEKCVKNAFTIYKEMVRKNKVSPIMLFNEADAIFSKRLSNIDDSVDQMMNAIQNIILQEMENIEGILIATTNLVGNLDPAFERRFIFKIRFEQPEKDVRTKIWKSMISEISEDDASRLADEFDSFSGGNIENVSRKSTIEYVLTGSRPTYDELVKYCREESLSDKARRNTIGY